ncbi:MAG: ribosome silencing factor [Acidobacteria bacterium]|nr:ribosome silencing factor [Acidobacteriota bacterium]
MTEDDVRAALERAAQAALDKKASDLLLLDLRGVSTFTGYFLLCTGQSARQVQAISDSVEEQLSRRALLPHHVEGYPLGEWVLLDYVDFIVHVFSARARAYYDLERLWRPANRLPVPEESRARAADE